MELLIEIPKGSHNKYEICKKSGRTKLDRVLHSSYVYPENYGYIEKTLAEDNDPLDVLVISTFTLLPGVLVDGRLLGGLEMIDGGERDTKLIYVVKNDPRFNHIQNIDDLGEHWKKEVVDFFSNYKNLQNKKVEVKEFLTKAVCEKLVIECQERYKKQ